MRNAWAFLILCPLATAAPDLVAAFQPAALLDTSAQSNDTVQDGSGLELLKRQQSCANGYSACVSINQPGLCCRTNQVCSVDGVGHPACCQVGAACTGTIALVTAAPATATGSATGTTTTGTQTSGPFATIATTTNSPFIQQSGGAGSTVSNAFFPFAYIPTTYTNAAACSNAYTSCQSDAASCTAALANGRQGVTVSAPNGGATITAIASVGVESAQSICSSLSQSACYGLQVEACRSFDGAGTNAAMTKCAGLYRMGAGVAVGLGGLLIT